MLSQLSYTPIGCGSTLLRQSLFSFAWFDLTKPIHMDLSSFSRVYVLMGLSGLEPPTSRLSGVRSNRLSYKPIESGIHLLSHAVSSIVPSAAYVLTVVFGMGTGVSHKRIDTRILVLSVPPAVLSESSYGASLPKPFRTVRQYDLSVTQI